jgi:hypothetical protein
LCPWFRVDIGRKSPFKRIATTTLSNLCIFLFSSPFVLLHHARNLVALASQPKPLSIFSLPKASSDNRADANPFLVLPVPQDRSYPAARETAFDSAKALMVPRSSLSGHLCEMPPFLKHSDGSSFSGTASFVTISIREHAFKQG